MSESVPQPRLEKRAASFQVAGLAGVLSAGLLLAWTSLKLPFICPLRALTGIPCPLCGMTTGTVAFLRGNLAESIRVAPLSVLFVPAIVAALAFKTKALIASPLRKVRSRPASRIGLALLAAALLSSWIFQLVRFGVI